MKLFFAATSLFILLVSASCPAITLKLDPEIDLLVLDGRKISGSLLKGADGLELDRGQHQFLFRVEKTPVTATTKGLHYQSVPMIVTFTASGKTVAIRLPALDSHRERHTFDKSLNFRLVDEQGKEIASIRDRLPLQSDGDLEQAMLNYNRNRQVASVPRFAVQTSSTPDVQLNADFTWQ